MNAPLNAPIRWLSGTVCATALTHPRLGVMLTPLMGNTPDLTRTTWGADNGCFAQPQRFNLRTYLGWLEGHAPDRSTCLFATAPDVLGDAAATWERSRPVLPLIRDLGYPAALVAQNGIEYQRIEWDAFDVLFIGGDDAWKLSEATYRLVGETAWRGKRVHVGRVNSYKRLQAFALAGAHSADGTFIRWAPDFNARRVLGWLDRLDREPPLWQVAI